MQRISFNRTPVGFLIFSLTAILVVTSPVQSRENSENSNKADVKKPVLFPRSAKNHTTQNEGPKKTQKQSDPSKATNIIGQEVKNLKGEELGEIQDLAIDPMDGRVSYAVLSFGGWFGIGDKLFAIPWSVFVPRPEGGFTLDIEKEKLKKAPGFAKNNWPDMANRKWGLMVHSFYQKQPYWEGKEGNSKAEKGLSAKGQKEKKSESPSSQKQAVTKNREADTGSAKNNPKAAQAQQPSKGGQAQGKKTGEGLQEKNTGQVQTVRSDQKELRIFKNTDLIGRSIKNLKGENLGEIEEVMVEHESGRLVYGIVSFGGWFGVGDKLYAVPWPVLIPHRDGAFVLKIDKEKVEKAPNYNKKTWPDMTDRNWGRLVHGYYGAKPYWENGPQPRKVSAQGKPEKGNDQISRIKDFLERQIKNLKGTNLGTIQSLAIDPDRGRIVYAIVAFGGWFGFGDKLYAVPWGALASHRDGFFILKNVDQKKLEKAPGYNKNQWPNMANRNWGTLVHNFYGEKPYWEE